MWEFEVDPSEVVVEEGTYAGPSVDSLENLVCLAEDKLACLFGGLGGEVAYGYERVCADAEMGHVVIVDGLFGLVRVLGLETCRCV